MVFKGSHETEETVPYGDDNVRLTVFTFQTWRASAKLEPLTGSLYQTLRTFVAPHAAIPEHFWNTLRQKCLRVYSLGMCDIVVPVHSRCERKLCFTENLAAWPWLNHKHPCTLKAWYVIDQDKTVLRCEIEQNSTLFFFFCNIVVHMYFNYFLEIILSNAFTTNSPLLTLVFSSHLSCTLQAGQSFGRTDISCARNKVGLYGRVATRKSLSKQSILKKIKGKENVNRAHVLIHWFGTNERRYSACDFVRR